ncbi:MAG: ribosome small subunit-dependent GTPase A, partial [Isosphaeraceae bacterium]
MIPQRNEGEGACRLAKKKKVRVDFRKNRQKRVRDSNLTRAYGRADPTGPEPVSAERIRAKGDLSRRRTVMQDVTEGDDASTSDDPAARLSVDLSECRPGRVVRIHGLESIVEDDDGELIRCGVRRLLKSLAIEGRNVIAVGDRVWFRPGSQGQGVIEKVGPRRGTITRGYRHREHMIASNI